MTQVTAEQALRMSLLRKIGKNVPAAADTVAADKKLWWAEVRKSLGIPSNAKLSVRLPSGTLIDKATNAPYVQLKRARPTGGYGSPAGY